MRTRKGETSEEQKIERTKVHEHKRRKIWRKYENTRYKKGKKKKQTTEEGRIT